jgi:soluble lytic murein transglycosylase-like protein
VRRVSVAAVLDRVSQLQALVDSAASGAVPGAPASGASFSAALTGATAASQAATLAGLSSPLAGDDDDGSDDGSADMSAASTLANLSSPLASVTPPAVAGATTVSSLPASVPYGAEITAAAQRNGLDPALLAGLIKQESGFNPNAGSPAGAQGLTQLMPGTAASLGVGNPLDPAQSIEGGARYLKQQLDAFGGDTARALAAYNAGPGAVQRFGGVPPYAETQNYVRAVQANAAALHSSPTIV